MIEAAHSFADMVLTLGADAQITSDHDFSYLGFPSGTEEGFEVANVFLEYAPESIEGPTIRSEINNIFDTRYAERGSYWQEFQGECSPLYEPDRSINIRATYTF